MAKQQPKILGLQQSLGHHLDLMFISWSCFHSYFLVWETMQAIPRWRKLLLFKNSIVQSTAIASTSNTQLAEFHSTRTSNEKWEKKWNSVSFLLNILFHPFVAWEDESAIGKKRLHLSFLCELKIFPIFLVIILRCPVDFILFLLIFFEFFEWLLLAWVCVRNSVLELNNIVVWIENELLHSRVWKLKAFTWFLTNAHFQWHFRPA